MAYPTQDPTAVVGLRLLAYGVDFLLTFIVLMLVVVPTFDRIAETYPASEYRCTQRNFDTGSTDRKELEDTPEDLCIRIGPEIKVVRGDDATRFALQFYGLAALLGIANSVVLQGLTGASIGKFITGLRVVRPDGHQAGLGRCALRWLLLLVDLFCCLLGVVLMASTKGHRRLGDMAASTFVVSRRSVGEPILVPGVNAPEINDAYPNPYGYPSQPPPSDRGPIWDEARDTYIQYDQDAWVQWDADERRWVPITRGDQPSEGDAPGGAP